MSPRKLERIAATRRVLDVNPCVLQATSMAPREIDLVHDFLYTQAALLMVQIAVFEEFENTPIMTVQMGTPAPEDPRRERRFLLYVRSLG